MDTINLVVTPTDPVIVSVPRGTVKVNTAPYAITLTLPENDYDLVAVADSFIVAFETLEKDAQARLARQNGHDHSDTGAYRAGCQGCLSMNRTGPEDYTSIDDDGTVR